MAKFSVYMKCTSNPDLSHEQVIEAEDSEHAVMMAVENLYSKMDEATREIPNTFEAEVRPIYTH